jgi:hypothetical protein
LVSAQRHPPGARPRNTQRVRNPVAVRGQFI